MKAKTSAMISLDQARMLVAHLEQGEFEQADTLIADACAPNAAALFDKVGQLTRQLHDSLQDFRLDPRSPIWPLTKSPMRGSDSVMSST